jgi:hypothetical protein
VADRQDKESDLELGVGGSDILSLCKFTSSFLANVSLYGHTECRCIYQSIYVTQQCRCIPPLTWSGPLIEVSYLYGTQQRKYLSALTCRRTID